MTELSDDFVIERTVKIASRVAQRELGRALRWRGAESDSFSENDQHPGRRALEAFVRHGAAINARQAGEIVAWIEASIGTYQSLAARDYGHGSRGDEMPAIWQEAAADLTTASTWARRLHALVKDTTTVSLDTLTA